MDKHKAKNIALGVSLALNVLGSLLIGGALIKSCNAPETAGNPSLSVSNAEKVNLYAPSKEGGAKPLFTHGENAVENSSGVGYLDFSDLSKWSGSTWLWKGTLSPLPTSVLESYIYNKVIYDQNGNEYANGYMCMSTGLSYIGDNNGQSVYTSVYTPSNGWVDVRYRWLTFGDSVSFLSEGNKDWFLGNADYQYGGSFSESSSSEQSSEQTSEVVTSSSDVITSDDTSSSIVETPTLITFPNDYNPLVAFGYVSDGLIGQLAGNKTSPFTLPMSFVSGGHDFKAVKIYFLSAQGLEYLPQGSSTTTTFSGEGYVYPMTMYYVDDDDNLLPAWRCVYGVKNDGNVYMRNYGEWLSTEYQRIEVIDYEPQFDISGLAPSLDQVGLLSLRTAHGEMTPVLGGNGSYDVFTLIGSAFNGIIPILEIQLLPYLTIGTLLFVPLVVLLIFAILKVLNK